MSCRSSSRTRGARSRESAVSDATRCQPALVIIDIQRQFAEGGQLGVPGSNRVLKPLAELLSSARTGGVPVVWTAFRLPTERVLGRSSLANMRRLGVTGLHVGPDAELLLTPSSEHSDLVIDKPRHSAFFGTPLESHLRALGVDTVVICGWTANVCVLATAFDAAARDFDVVVVPEATWAMPIPETGGQPGLEAQAVVDTSMALVRWSLGRTMSAGAAQLLLEGRPGDPAGDSPTP